MDPSTALWMSNFMKISSFWGLRVRRQDDLDGSFYHTFDVEFHENNTVSGFSNTKFGFCVKLLKVLWMHVKKYKNV